MQITFKIYGGGRTLAADGIAIWYTAARMGPGPVFGSMDEFKGLGVFLDTYKNGEQAVSISFKEVYYFLFALLDCCCQIR